MAKLEHKTKKQKGKKRKHAATEIEEDEVANKSLIVERMEQQEEPAKETKTKAIKRKKKCKDKIKEKRSKRTEYHDEDNQIADDDSGDEEDNLYAPTMNELKESEKPENTIAILTVRQKKKQKHQQRVLSRKDQMVGKEFQRNEEYLRKWKNTRAEWKFEKLRQISIQQFAFDMNQISIEVWPIALEYLSGSKGAAKDKIIKLAEDIIDELDKQCAQKQDEAEKQAIVDSVKYQRARDLLQSFT